MRVPAVCDEARRVQEARFKEEEEEYLVALVGASGCVGDPVKCVGSVQWKGRREEKRKER